MCILTYEYGSMFHFGNLKKNTLAHVPLPYLQTTTIGMLTGHLPPTGGAAWVAGLDIRRQLHKVYQSMGVCPQDNLLWDHLTGREHLAFFGRLKGLGGGSCGSIGPRGPEFV